MSDPSISLSSLLVESREGSKVGKEWFCALFTYANFGKMTEPKVLGVTAIIFRVNLHIPVLELDWEKMLFLGWLLTEQSLITQQTTEEIVGNMALPTMATAISRIPILSELQNETARSGSILSAKHESFLLSEPINQSSAFHLIFLYRKIQKTSLSKDRIYHDPKFSRHAQLHYYVTKSIKDSELIFENLRPH